jgi:hypothetical protein
VSWRRLMAAALVLLAMLALAAPGRVVGDCGVALLVSSGPWRLETVREVYSIVPGLVPPGRTANTSSPVPSRAESVLVAELRPPLPPSTSQRLCLRSAEPLVEACSGGNSSRGGGGGGGGGDGNQGGSGLLFVNELGAPLGPCLEIDAGGRSAATTRQRPRRDDCWPGGGYCSDGSGSWGLAPITPAPTSGGMRAVQLRAQLVASLYQDTDGATTTTTGELTYHVHMGCVLGVAAAGGAGGVQWADPKARFCPACAPRDGATSVGSGGAAQTRMPQNMQQQYKQQQQYMQQLLLQPNKQPPRSALIPTAAMRIAMQTQPETAAAPPASTPQQQQQQQQKQQKQQAQHVQSAVPHATLGRLTLAPIGSNSTACLRCPSGSNKAPQPSSWTCVAGMPRGFEAISVRMGNAGNPQCASWDGRACIRGRHGCSQLASFLRENGTVQLAPLTCGPAHAVAWPAIGTGYGTSGHWCVVAREALQDAQPLQHDGRCMSGA